MENNNIEFKKNLYVEKVNEINEEYKDKKIFPIGDINNVTYADLGKTLSLELSGDVPSDFEQVNIIIVHPDSEKDGWIGKGKIGMTIAGEGVDISRIPLTSESISLIKEIYKKYTGSEANFLFRTISDNNNVTELSVPGLYKDIISKNK